MSRIPFAAWSLSLISVACAPPPVVTTPVAATVRENAAAGAAVGTVSATGGDGTFAFAIASQSIAGALAVDAATGAVTVADATKFDFETAPSLTADVKVTSAGLEATSVVTVTLTNDLREAADGVLAWFRLDGNSDEVFGTDYDGETNATATTDRKGTAGAALQFGPIGQDRAKADLGAVPLSGSFSVAFWMLVPTETSTAARASGAGYRVLSKRSVCNAGDFFDLQFSNGAQYGNTLGAEIRGDGASLGSSPSMAMNQLPVGAWFHVALVVDSSARKTAMYMDGDLTTPPLTYQWQAGAPLPTLGGRLGIATSPCIGNEGVLGFVGSLDDVVVFGRALTAAEVKTIATE